MSRHKSKWSTTTGHNAYGHTHGFIEANATWVFWAIWIVRGLYR